MSCRFTAHLLSLLLPFLTILLTEISYVLSNCLWTVRKYLSLPICHKSRVLKLCFKHAWTMLQTTWMSGERNHLSSTEQKTLNSSKKGLILSMNYVSHLILSGFHNFNICKINIFFSFKDHRGNHLMSQEEEVAWNKCNWTSHQSSITYFGFQFNVWGK